MPRRAFRLGNTSSSTVSAILAVFTTRLPIPIPTSSRTPTRSRINTSQPALERNVRQENVQSTQILPQPFALIPLLTPPITPARRPTGPTRTLLRSPLRRSPQDKIDALVETRGGLAGSRRIEVISGGVAWDRRKFAVGSEGAGLGQSAREDWSVLQFLLGAQAISVRVPFGAASLPEAKNFWMARKEGM
jgi:hypothetical protein